MTPSELKTLAGRVAAATGPDRKLDAAIGLVAGPAKMQPDGSWVTYHDDGYTHSLRPPAYTGSLDAAMTLVPEKAAWALWESGAYAVVVPHSEEPDEETAASAWGGNPALALTAAALRARANQGATDE